MAKTLNLTLTTALISLLYIKSNFVKNNSRKNETITERQQTRTEIFFKQTYKRIQTFDIQKQFYEIITWYENISNVNTSVLWIFTKLRWKILWRKRISGFHNQPWLEINKGIYIKQSDCLKEIVYIMTSADMILIR